ncbi:MAG: hypothetical protein CMJ78_03670 [Planctomycetaceae bacterium]|nr:hypothetical protein [Planctomycetaceae bacterium]
MPFTMSDARDESSASKQLVAALGATLALSVVAAVLPGRLKLIGLFAIAFGVVSGLLSRHMFQGEGNVPKSQRFRILTAAVIAFMGFVVWHGVSYVRYSDAVDEVFKGDPQQALMGRVPNQDGPQLKALTETAKAEREEKRRQLKSLPSYLRQRTKSMGLGPLVASLLFGGEMLAACVAAGMINRDGLSNVAVDDSAQET